MMIADPRPIILTALMDDRAQCFFDERRERYFPAHRNWLEAHVTLFHALPGERHAQIVALLTSEAARTPVLTASVTGLRNLGGGVAYALRSETLSALRRRLAQAWSGWLTPQDSQGFNPHVTVQNKVTGAEARRTAELLRAEFSPFEIVVRGIAVWRYDGGPWSRGTEHLFAQPVGRDG